MQDEIADDMISMAHSLKHNSLVAKDIIISDTKAYSPLKKFCNYCSR